MEWDRHKLLWDGNGTDKYVPWTTLVIWPLVTIVQQKEYLPILAHGYLSSNIYDHFSAPHR